MTKGTEPPPSRYPRLTDLQLVAANKTAMGFPDIPGVPGLLNLVFDYDFGPDFDYVDESGLITRQPPVVKRVLTTLTDSGHQTSILTTNFQAPMTTLAVSLFARWSQENFFRYMREHYSLDRLIEYGTEAIPDAVSVVNPAWRKLDSQIRSTTGRRHRQAAQSGALALSEEPTESQVQGFQQRKGNLQEEIQVLDLEIDKIKQLRKKTEHHVPVNSLPAEDRFTRLRTERKHFIDVLKMIAYRAETSMASLLAGHMARGVDDARALLRQIYQNEADLTPDLATNTLTIRLHHLTQATHDLSIDLLLAHLNATQTVFPGTTLTLVFKLGSA